MRRTDQHRGPERGMSLVEVVVAVVVLGILASAVLAVILQTQAAGVNNRSRIAASNLAAREIDMVRDAFSRSDVSALAIADAGTQVNANPFDAQPVGQPLVVDGTPYTVTREVHWNITGSGASACAGGSLVVYPTLAVHVSVSWPHMGQVKPVVSDAVLAPAKGNGVPGTASFIAVKVEDSLGLPNPGRTIKVVGGTETKIGTTDASGCAVLQVNPAVGLGTTYTAQATDAGYVDISGTTGPVKNVGQLARGQLNNAVTFAYAQAGTVRLRLIDPSGGAIDPNVAVGSTVTLVAGETAGETTTATTVTGTVTVVSNLWPTWYGAYFGATAPVGGYTSVPLAPGGSLDIDVPFAVATGSLFNLPAGTTSVLAAPAPATVCTAPGVRTVDPAAFSMLPGSWNFFASGATFTCSPGPSSVALHSGPNDGTEWLTTTLQVQGAPVSGTLWAVDRTKVSGPVLTSCPGSAYAPYAVNVDAARSTPVPLPAGDWYIFRTGGGAADTCLGIPGGQYSKTLTYGVPHVLTWVSPSATVKVNGVGQGLSLVYGLNGAASIDCTRTGVPFGYSTPGGSTTPLLAPGTYTFYSWNKANTASTPRCVFGGTVVIGGLTSYTLPFSSTLKPVVGP